MSIQGDNGVLTGCGCMTLILLVTYLPIAFWTDRNLDFWISHIKGETVDVPFWLSMVISLFEPIVLLDIIGEIARYFI